MLYCNDVYKQVTWQDATQLAHTPSVLPAGTSSKASSSRPINTISDNTTGTHTECVTSWNLIQGVQFTTHEHNIRQHNWHTHRVCYQDTPSVLPAGTSSKASSSRPMNTISDNTTGTHTEYVTSWNLIQGVQFTTHKHVDVIDTDTRNMFHIFCDVTLGLLQQVISTQYTNAVFYIPV